MQNRLEHSISSLSTIGENITAAENRISSTDMAEEMMNFTRQNIIAQSAQSMLAQAMEIKRSEVQQLIAG